jgi:hypothetical protein
LKGALSTEVSASRLDESIVRDRIFDLAVCLEDAKHLTLQAFLRRFADVVCRSLRYHLGLSSA